MRSPLTRPAGPAGVFNRARESLFVKLRADDGLEGWGETYALPGVRQAVEALAPLLVGLDVPGALGRWWPARQDSDGLGPARAALDIALHDLCGRVLGVPVHQLLGGARRDRVRVYASGLLYVEGLHPRERWEPEAARLVTEGFTAVKVRVGGFPVAEELPLLRQLRRALPEHVELMVDAWGAYGPATALRVGRCLDELGAAWFEEPLPPEPDHGGYDGLARALDTPVAGGEMVQTRAGFRTLLERGAFDIVQPDPCICGGLREALFVAELAQLFGVRCVPHTWNGAVMNAATLHVIAAMPGRSDLPGADAPLLEYDTSENPFMREVLDEAPALRDGCFEVPSLPGLGVSVDERRLREYAA